jgi:hypothetical protein
VSNTATTEQRVRQALRERADAMPVRATALPLPTVAAAPRRPRPVVWAVAAAVVVLVAAAVAVAHPFASDSTPAEPTSTTAPQSTTTTTVLLPSPPAEAGVEVPITAADTKDTQFLIRYRRRSDPNFQPSIVVSQGLAPILVTPGCLTIAAAPVPTAGFQGGCVPNPADSFVGTIDTADPDVPGSKAYGAWVQLPEGTSYVTYSYGPERWWQRPLDGITYTAVDATPKYGPAPLVARAFDASGKELAEISRAPRTAGGGRWAWL